VSPRSPVAFVSSHAAIEKRITRAKKLLAGSKRLFDVAAPSDFAARLPAVYRVLYLLFNEGYHGASAESAVRSALCHEAMRLAALLLEHRLGATPATYALSALMHLNGARLPARVDAAGDLQSLFDQDRSLWDGKLVLEGLKLLEFSASGSDSRSITSKRRSHRFTRPLCALRTPTGVGSFRYTIR
jgi:RNA polymerase sigma-70 factor (ECF subfamily)